MFELPDAKRVRRQDLYDSASERQSSPEDDDGQEAEVRAKLNARLSALFALNISNAHDPMEEAVVAEAEAADGGVDANVEPEFEFRLFSTSAPKVVLASDAEMAGIHQGPAISRRPLSCHIRGELTPKEQERFQFSAVSGSQVVDGARQRAWGLEVPWRVTKITISTGEKGKNISIKPQPPSAAASFLGGQESSEVVQGKRKRPGKKRRIALRIKDKAKKEQELEKMTKEEHLKEKKKRLNRERKLKRRQKEKEKKLVNKGEGGDDAGAETQSESEA
ncbi:hypothetical protein B0H63DRAFT_479880, partial [Podospora didyma]